MRSRAEPASICTPFVGSEPRTMFSHTVRLSASMKCWNTMPMPALMASFGDLKWVSTPFTPMVPSSGRWAP